MKHILESTGELSLGAKVEVSTFDRDGIKQVLFDFTGVDQNLNLVNGVMSISKEDLHEFIGILLHVQSKLKNR